MPTTYSPSLRLSLIATGEQAGNWGNITNTNLGTLLEESITGYINVEILDANYTLTVANGATDESRNANIKITSFVTLTATRTVVIPNAEKSYYFWNASTGTQNIRIGTSTSPSVYVDIPKNYGCFVFCDGSNNVYQVTPFFDVTSYSLIAGSVTPSSSTAPTNGLYLPSANTLGLSTNSAARFYIGSAGQLGIGGATYGTSGQALKSDGPSSPPTWGDVGSVTSVALSGGTTGLTTSGGPITSSGTITLAGTLGYANGGTGVTALPSNGEVLIGNGSGYSKATLTAGTNVSITNGSGTITINATSSGTVSSVAQTFTGGLISVSGSPITSSGTLALTVAGTSGGIPYFSSASGWASSSELAANSLVVGGGAGVAPSTITTGTGVTSALGQTTNTTSGFITGSGTVTLTNKTISGSTNTITNVSLTSGVTGTLPVGNGGTGITTTPSNGFIPIGNGSTYTAAALTAGTGIGVSNGAGSVTVSTSGAYTANGYTMSTSRLLGRTSGGTGAAEEIIVGSGLTLSGGTLNTVSSGGVDVQTFTANGTWTKPSGYAAGSRVFVQAWGAGGSGSRNSTASSTAGGGGGGYNEVWLALSDFASTETITIGAGGAAKSGSGGNTNGSNGGNTTVGSLVTSYGGAGGQSGGAAGGGPGSAASGNAPGSPLRLTSINGSSLGGSTPQYIGFIYEGSPAKATTNGGCTPTYYVTNPSAALWHGGAGGYSFSGGSGTGYLTGVPSIWGGAGGGGGNTSTGTGGASTYGGNGGNCGTTGTAGSQPGGGGGGGTSTSGAGGDGKVIITVFAA